jgi:hypothetical protein
MDALLRGTIERHLDTLLTEEDSLINASKMFKEVFSPTVKYLEDALFGYVIGRILEFSFFAIHTYYYRSPNDEEFLEIGKILQRRAIEIKSKVTLAANR